MRNLTAPGWLSRLAYTVAVVSTLGLALSAAGALGDAGNPILGTITGSAVDNGNGTVTISVRGQWNWLSHASDCNADRAGTGVGIIWNDPTETGYTVGTGSISQRVGIALLRNGDTVNTVDRMVHPVDRGNVAEGYVVAGTHYPAKQAIVDPSPPNPASFATWKGGCGRLPLSATASTGANPDRTGLTCGNGTLTCAGRPWGSWGYERTYSHTYLKSAVPAGVCVNFYDVHNGKGFQAVKAAKEITVDGNGDNSIQTNSFNVSGGANCISTSRIIDPKIEITQTTSTPTVVSGGTATFQLKVENTGASTLTDVVVTDALAPDCARTKANIAGLASLAPAATVTYSCTKAGLLQDFANSATATGTPPFGPDVTDTDTVTVAVTPPVVTNPAITIDLGPDDPDAVGPDEQEVRRSGTAKFRITVTNTGDVTLTNVEVTDLLATGCARTKADADTPELVSMAPTATVTYSCTLANVMDSFTNLAKATGKPPVGADVSGEDTTVVTVTEF